MVKRQLWSPADKRGSCYLWSRKSGDGLVWNATTVNRQPQSQVGYTREEVIQMAEEYSKD